jgi:hypothetical protein
MHQSLADLRSGVRMLLKYPTLSLVAVVTLGVGIGLSTTVFSVVNGALFKGPPFPDADRIVALGAARTPSRCSTARAVESLRTSSVDDLRGAVADAVPASSFRYASAIQMD